MPKTRLQSLRSLQSAEKTIKNLLLKKVLLLTEKLEEQILN